MFLSFTRWISLRGLLFRCNLVILLGKLLLKIKFEEDRCFLNYVSYGIIVQYITTTIKNIRVSQLQEVKVTTVAGQHRQYSSSKTQRFTCRIVPSHPNAIFEKCIIPSLQDI